MKFHGTLLFAAILVLFYSSYAASQQDEFTLPTPYSPDDIPGSKEMLKQVRKSAKKGDATAQYQLGLAYLLGNQISQNPKDAVKWLLKSAEQGYVPAQFRLGLLYFQGDRISQDYVQAANWLRKAAEQEYTQAQFYLGLLYLQGNGVSQDYAEAAKYLRNPAEQGNPLAQFHLGLLYSQGNGVTQDYTEAAKWLFKSAEQDNTSAQCMLGAIYVEGWGVTKDAVQAYMWLNLSISGQTGMQTPYLQKATALRDSLVNTMTSQQIQEAERLAGEWERGHVRRLDNIVYLVGRGVSAPKIFENPPPIYTELARRERINGIVHLQCIVREDGTVGDFRVLKKLGYGLDESAIGTIATRWLFIPATYQGKPVAVQIDLEVTFRIQ
jgi:TonB family protein